MNNEYKTTSECSFKLAKEPFSMAKLCFYLTKNSPYTQHINKGQVLIKDFYSSTSLTVCHHHSIMEMMQYGFLQHWEKQFMPQLDKKCSDNHQKQKKMRISLGNFSGVFVLLFVGWSCAFFAFLIEKIVYYRKLNRIAAFDLQQKINQIPLIQKIKNKIRLPLDKLRTKKLIKKLPTK